MIPIMQGVGMPCNLIMDAKESLEVEISEMKCLILWAKNILFWVFDSNFCTHNMNPTFGNRERNHDIINCIKWWKLNSKEMLLNDIKHTILKRKLWNRLPRTLKKRYNCYSILVIFNLCNIWITPLFYIVHHAWRIPRVGFWFNN